MIENYEDLNVEETLEAVADFDGDRLAEFLEYEQEHKDRKTVLEALDDELVTVTPTGNQYAGGIWFDELDAERTVRRSARIDRAIDAGELEVIDDE
jgi:hypothetical protein